MVDCASPFGKGLGYNISTDTFKGGSTFLVTGPFKFYFNQGTIHGTYRITATASSAGVSGSGTYKVTGGTGAFKHVSGSGKISGSTNGTTGHYTRRGTYSGT